MCLRHYGKLYVVLNIGIQWVIFVYRSSERFTPGAQELANRALPDCESRQQKLLQHNRRWLCT